MHSRVRCGLSWIWGSGLAVLLSACSSQDAPDDRGGYAKDPGEPRRVLRSGEPGAEGTEREPTFPLPPARGGETILSPSQALELFFAALRQGELAEADSYHAVFPLMPDGIMRPYLERLAGDLQAGRRSFEVLESRADADVAVVIVRESTPGEDTSGGPLDLDPAYLIVQQGRWKVLPKLARFDRGYFRISTDQRRRFEALAGWFEERKRELQAAESRSKR
jgi:hypothetical protein